MIFFIIFRMMLKLQHQQYLVFLEHVPKHWSEAITLAPVEVTKHLHAHVAAEDPCPWSLPPPRTSPSTSG